MSLLDDLIKSKTIKSYLKYVNIIEENSDEIRLLDVLKNESISMTLNEKDYLVKKIFELDDNYPLNLFTDNKYFKYNELEFFNSNDGDVNNSIFSKINYTSSILGKYKLINILTNPKTNGKILNQRKKLIEKCSRSNLKERCSKISELEGDVLWFFKEKPEEINNMLSMIYFDNFWNKWFNDNQLILNIYFNFKLIIIPLYGLLFPVIIIILPYIILKNILKMDVSFSLYWKIIKKIYFTGTGITTVFSNFSKLFNFENKKEKTFTEQIVNVVIQFFTYLSKSNFGVIIYYLFTGISYIYGLYTTLDYSYSYLKIIKFFNEKINKVVEFIYEIKEIYKEFKYFDNDEIKEKFEGKLDSKDIENLLDIDYKKEVSYLFSDKGCVLKNFYFIQKNYKELKVYLDYYSYIDAWSSVSYLYKEKNLSLPIFVKHNKPYIKLEQFNNIGIDNSVKNDIVMKDKNLIITGPNASGKSTFLKSMITNIILGQTICVSSSDKFILTPFKHINTYLNIPDCQGKESLFQAEMNRCYNQIELLKKTKKNAFVFTIMDEIFVSTNYQEGVSGAYAISKKMGTFDNSLCIVSTHFPILCKVFDNTPKFKNYYFSIEENNKKTYKIKEGFSKQHMALELLNRKGFDKDIIQNSKKMFNYLKKKI